MPDEHLEGHAELNRRVTALIGDALAEGLVGTDEIEGGLLTGWYLVATYLDGAGDPSILLASPDQQTALETYPMLEVARLSCREVLLEFVRRDD